jgi:hypothetical protein
MNCAAKYAANAGAVSGYDSSSWSPYVAKTKDSAQLYSLRRLPHAIVPQQKINKIFTKNPDRAMKSKRLQIHLRRGI